MEIEIIENHMPPKFDEYSLNDKYYEIEMIENDSHETYEEKESEYFEVEFIDDNKPRVFDSRPIEHDFYIVDFIEDYIYDMFAQRFEMKFARWKIKKYIIDDKLHKKISRMKVLRRKHLCKKANVYKFYHQHYK